MSPVRKWGIGPYSVAVIHGGPGAPGEMASVAESFPPSKGYSSHSRPRPLLKDKCGSLRSVLIEHGREPLTLVGFSWGAYLSWMVAARYPALVGKLILVGSPPFEEQYAAPIIKTRLDRLTPENRMEAQALLTHLEGPVAEGNEGDRNALLARRETCLPMQTVMPPRQWKTNRFIAIMISSGGSGRCVRTPP